MITAPDLSGSPGTARVSLPGGQLVGGAGEHLDRADPGHDGRHRRGRRRGVRRRQGLGALGRRLARRTTGSRPACARCRRRHAGAGWASGSGAAGATPIRGHRSPCEHPDWLATWRGHVPVLSFDNHGLCLGHDPARDWVLGELSRMVPEFGLTWLLHDFETIARCDSTAHTHDPGAGEHAAEAAFHHILRSLAARFPDAGAGELLERRPPARPRHDQEPPHHDHRGPLPDPLQQPGQGRPRPLSAAGLAERLHGGRRPAAAGPDRAVRDRRPVGADGRPGDLDRAESRRTSPGRRRCSRPGAPTSARPRSPGSPTTPASVDTVLATLADGRALLAISAPPGVRQVELDPGFVGHRTCCGTSGRAPRARRISTARRG